MASIDRIYLNFQQFEEFVSWVQDNEDKCKKESGEGMVQYLKFRSVWEMFSEFGDIPKGEFSVSNFSRNVDAWLMKNCPIAYIQKRLKEQYSTT